MGQMPLERKKQQRKRPGILNPKDTSHCDQSHQKKQDQSVAIRGRAGAGAGALFLVLLILLMLLIFLVLLVFLPTIPWCQQSVSSQLKRLKG